MNHHECLLDVYMTAIALKTWINKTSHINFYLRFYTRHNISPFAPSVYDLLSFLLCLRDNLRSPQSMMNYFSSVKVWITSRVGALLAFDALEIRIMKWGLFKNSKHVPTRAPGVTPEKFKMIINYLSTMDPPPYCVNSVLNCRLFHPRQTKQSHLYL